MAHEHMHDAISTDIGGFTPAGGTDLEEWAGGIPELIEQFGQAFTDAAGNMEHLPVAPEFLESLREFSSAFAGLADSAREQYKTFAETGGDFWLGR